MQTRSIVAVALLALSALGCRPPPVEAPEVAVLPSPEQGRPLQEADPCEEIGPARSDPQTNAPPGVQCPRADYPRVEPQLEVRPPQQ
jgi:hypothetical protein